MRDNYGRTISYMRMSVTDRCNLRCRYCMPESGINKLEHDKILSFEDIIAIAEAASDLGISKIRLTGGEPLVRRNITGLVSQLAGIPGIEEVTLTTNGTLFARMVKALRAGGLKRVNFSLDSLSAEKYDYITRGGCL
ncbi:MAG TPA: GTP 3',8-cyclase MoaA, partial [Syntrophomonas sp.]|nr:GTP 3',8-cyclase MoaA [Syntrophomonas sp.]